MMGSGLSFPTPFFSYGRITSSFHTSYILLVIRPMEKNEGVGNRKESRYGDIICPTTFFLSFLTVYVLLLMVKGRMFGHIYVSFFPYLLFLGPPFPPSLLFPCAGGPNMGADRTRGPQFGGATCCARYRKNKEGNGRWA